MGEWEARSARGRKRQKHVERMAANYWLVLEGAADEEMRSRGPMGVCALNGSM